MVGLFALGGSAILGGILRRPHCDVAVRDVVSLRERICIWAYQAKKSESFQSQHLPLAS